MIDVDVTSVAVLMTLNIGGTRSGLVVTKTLFGLLDASPNVVTTETKNFMWLK